MHQTNHSMILPAGWAGFSTLFDMETPIFAFVYHAVLITEDETCDARSVLRNSMTAKFWKTQKSPPTALEENLTDCELNPQILEVHMIG